METGGNSDSKKRELLASLETERKTRRQERQSAGGTAPQSRIEAQLALARISGRRGASEPAGGSDNARPDLEVLRLREELQESRSTCGLLEREMRELEDKALAAIAEAGRLRKLLTEKPETGDAATESPEARRLRGMVEIAERERRLLTGALCDSEMEIARLAKALEKMARRFTAA